MEKTLTNVTKRKREEREEKKKQNKKRAKRGHNTVLVKSQCAYHDEVKPMIYGRNDQ